MLRKVIAVIAGFVVLIAIGVLGFNLFGHAMLQAVDWQAGMPPPPGYVWFTLATDLIGSTLAGVLLAWIAGTSPYKTASILIILAMVLRAYQYVSALDPHWYAFVLIVLPLAGVLIGVRLRDVIAGRRSSNPDPLSAT